MCRFHKELATEVATDPITRGFDPVAYSVTLVALAKYWIDGYMPVMADCDGYSDYAMATPKAIEALERSGINLNREDIADYRNLKIGTVRDAIKDIIVDHYLTLQSLNLPKNPVKDSVLLDDAMVAIYQGDPAVALTLRQAALNPAHEALRRAVEAFTAKPGIEPALRRLQEGSFATIFLAAREKVSPLLLKAYARLPEKLTGAFKTCAMCVGGGAGGAAVSHVGCVLVPAIAGASGSALSASMNTLMLVTSPAIAAAVTAGIEKMRGRPQSIPKIAGSAAFAFAVALGVNHFNGHDHGDHHDHGHRSEIESNAKAMNMTVKEYEGQICVAPRP